MIGIVAGKRGYNRIMNQHDQQPPVFSPPPPVEPAPIEPTKKSRTGLFAFLGCGGCAVLGAVGVVVAVYVLFALGMGIFTDQVKADLSDNPVILEHIGLIEDLEVDLVGSFSAEGDDEFVFDIAGPKGRGVVKAVCITRDADTEEVVSGTLRVGSGEVFDLFPPEP